MSREKFYQEVRTAWRRSHARASAWTDRSGENRPIRELGLSPLKGYIKKDFGSLPPELRGTLHSAVRAFQDFSKDFSREVPNSEDAFSEGKRLLEDICIPLRKIILDEWQTAVESLITDAELWCERKGWPSRRETKTVSESLLGEYELARLLAYVDVSHVLVEGISRFALNAIGVAELTLIPSYDSIKIILTVEGWKVRMPSDEGPDDASFVDWDRKAFEGAVGYLTSLRV